MSRRAVSPLRSLQEMTEKVLTNIGQPLMAQWQREPVSAVR